MLSTPKKSSIRFNYRDYNLLPDFPRHELIDGDLYMTPSPITPHQMASARLGYRLTEFVLKNNLGLVLAAPMDVVLSDEDVVQPDILFISNERRGIIKHENLRGAPDLVIEILSPASMERDRVTKNKLYAKYAVREYWIVDPDQKTIEVMTWSEEGFKGVQVYPSGATLRSPLLKEFSLNVRDIFQSI